MSDKSPDAFRTISEVADWLGVQPHVLRFWESKFSQVRPVKRAGGRRYYRPNDMLLLGGIRKLLHEDGLTIKGAQKVLREEGMSHVARLSQPLDPESAALSDMTAEMEEDHAPSPKTPGQVLEFDQGPGERTAPSTPAAPQPETAAQPESEAPARPALSGTPQPQPEAASEPATAEIGHTEPRTAPEGREKPAEKVPERSALPSFMRDPATRKPPAPEPQDPPRDAHAEPAATDRLPSFLQPPKPSERDPEPPRPTAASQPEEAEAEMPLELPATEAEPEPEPESAKARPKIVDAPDPDESAIAVASGALSASFFTASVSPQRRAEVLPLVAQLAALRDRMAAARGR